MKDFMVSKMIEERMLTRNPDGAPIFIVLWDLMHTTKREEFLKS